jgi:ATP-dependent DNA helicase PIF1
LNTPKGLTWYKRKLGAKKYTELLNFATMQLKTPLVLSADFNYAIDLIDKSKRSLFLTGKAGTGKSTLLHLMRSTVRKKMAVLAPTGVAALNVQGQTIHSFFGFPPRLITRQVADQKTSRKDLLRLYKGLEVLVIDEISMVRADILDGIDVFLRRNRENYQPFGGVQVILVGDLFQLPPVVKNDPVERSFFQEHYETPYFFSANVFKDPEFSFEHLELRKVYRQDSRHFLRLLEAVRLNTLDQDDLEDLNERYLPNFSDTEGYITLCARNATADRINQRALEQLEAPAFTYNAEVSGQFDPLLYPTDPMLKLKKGAQVMFIKNDVERDFVNGTIGIVTSVQADSVTVKITDESGKNKKVDVVKSDWEILKYRASATGVIEAEPIGSFRQYPLKLAWAITIHKSQGKTFDKVLLDLGGGAFEHGQLYVALSRCRTLEGIVLRQPIRPSDVITDDRVVDYYQNAFR